MTDRHREQWSSKIGFVLAAAGSAVGLGNIWRFPYVAGENGGAAFILIYIICVIFLGAPIMLAELAIGRHTQRNPISAFSALSPRSKWFLTGVLGVVAGYLILSFYAIIAGQVLGYFFEMALGVLSGLTPMQVSRHYEQFASNITKSIGYFLAFMFLTTMVVRNGISKGIERVSKILMPGLFLLIVILIVRSLTLEGAGIGVSFLFKPVWANVKTSTLAAAVGQAFFSLSLGMGAMITYGSYLNREQNLVSSTAQICFLDTIVALLAGLAIFPSLFVFGLDAAAGPGLIFVTLPNLFNVMPGGQLWGAIFFLLLLFAALTSTISILEVIVSYFIDDRGWKRGKAAFLSGAFCFLIGLPSAMALGPWKAFTVGPYKYNLFDLVAHISSEYMLAIGAFLIALFTGYAWGERLAEAEVKEGSPGFSLGRIWIFLLRTICPFFIGQIVIFLILEEFAGSASVQQLTEALITFFLYLNIVVGGFTVIGSMVYFLSYKRRQRADSVFR